MSGGQGPIRARYERDDIMGPGSGYTLRMMRRGAANRFAMLTDLQWIQFEDGATPDHYLNDHAIPGGSLPEFMQAIMDAGWEQGIRPSVMSAVDRASSAHIDSLREHIKSLQGQLENQNRLLDKLLSK